MIDSSMNPFFLPCRILSSNEYYRRCTPVSYTHLDVYKRQTVNCPLNGKVDADVDVLILRVLQTVVVGDFGIGAELLHVVDREQVVAVDIDSGL